LKSPSPIPTSTIATANCAKADAYHPTAVPTSDKLGELSMRKMVEQK